VLAVEVPADMALQVLMVLRALVAVAVAVDLQTLLPHMAVVQVVRASLYYAIQAVSVLLAEMR
jgi:hypothetical protein